MKQKKAHGAFSSGKGISGQGGQMAVEMVLLMTLMVAIFLAVSAQFRDKEYIANIISRPWQSISSMIQNGVWDSKKVHPAHQSRWISVRGDESQ